MYDGAFGFNAINMYKQNVQGKTPEAKLLCRSGIFLLLKIEIFGRNTGW